MTDYHTLDVETTGTETFKSDLICVGIDDTVHPPEEGMAKAEELLLSDEIIVCHTNFDIRDLVLRGCRWGDKFQFHDTKVLAFMLDQTQELALDSLCKKYLDLDVRKPIHQLKGRVMYDCRKGMGLCPELGDIPIEDVPWNEMAAYNGQDIKVEGQLYEALRWELMNSGDWDRFFLPEEAPLSRILIEMEVAGMPVDQDGITQFLDRANEERWKLHDELCQHTGVHGFNLKSPFHVGAYLYDELPEFKVQVEVPGLSQFPGQKGVEKRWELSRQMLPDVEINKAGTKFAYGVQRVEGLGLAPPPRRKKGGKESARPPIDAETLVTRYNENPWVSKYLRWKSLQTLCANYLEKWIVYAHEGRLHGRYDQARAETGRLASRDPNLQAIPIATDFSVRTLFQAPLFIADYSGLDARVAAHFCEDPLLLQIFRENLDLYGTLAANAWGGAPDKSNPNRGLMKILYLSSQYGAQHKSIGDKIRISGLGEKWAKQSEKLLHQMEETVPRMYEWRREVEAQARRDGYITTITGRRRYLSDLYSDEFWRKSRAERQCVASMVQGSSADIVRRAMLALRQQIDPAVAKIVLQVHDELVLERGPEWEDSHFDQIVDILQYTHEKEFHADSGATLPGFPMRVPMTVSASIGDSWEDKGAEGARSYRRRA